MKKLFMSIIMMLFAFLTMGATNQMKTNALNYSPDEFKVVSLNGDTSCIISKTYELQSSMKAGEPYLPVIHTSVLLPADATVESVTVNKTSDKELATDILLLNNQFPVAASEDFVMPENPWYEQKNYP
ncbi:MAG: hypothetical protein IJ244_07195, partial [Bacteroidaceae bacterium]|nr:hypothetical protein [Bacteroidaceae bacterium]